MISVWIVPFILSSCTAVIYHLNDTEYQRMPPLWVLDDYESCLVEEGSAYCMLQLTLYAEPGNQLKHLINEYSDFTMKHYNHSIIDRGVCIKQTCQKYFCTSETTEDLKQSLEICVSDSLWKEYGLRAKVSRVYYCSHHDESDKIDAWDWTVLVAILGIVLMNIIGSIYDNNLRKQTEIEIKNGNVYLFSFSVKRNWEKLMNTEVCNSKINDLQCIHGMRVIANFCTIIMHGMMIFTIGFSRNSHDIEKTYEYPLYYLLHNGLVFVQIFFFISGFLKGYDFQSEEEKRSISIQDIPKTMLLRLSRLVPTLAVTMALVTSWARHVGSGPLWKLYVTDSLVADCRSCWWHHLFFINNYVQGSKFCLISTWHLAADMQVFLVGVTVYLLSRRRLLPSVLLLTALAPALHTLLQDLDAVIVTPEFLRTWESRMFWLLRVQGHNSLPSFLMGLLAGTRLYDWQKKGRHLEKRWWWSLLQYVSILLLPLIMYSGCIFYADRERAGILLRAAYNSSIRILLGLTSTLAAYAFINKTPSYLKSLFEWRWWTMLSRLTYCVFLLHMIFIHMLMGIRSELSYYSFPNVLYATFVVVVVSYLISLPLHLMVEAPFTIFFKSFATKRSAVKNAGAKEKQDKVL